MMEQSLEQLASSSESSESVWLPVGESVSSLAIESDITYKIVDLQNHSASSSM